MRAKGAVAGYIRPVPKMTANAKRTAITNAPPAISASLLEPRTNATTAKTKAMSENRAIAAVDGTRNSTFTRFGQELMRAHMLPA